MIVNDEMICSSLFPDLFSSFNSIIFDRNFRETHIVRGRARHPQSQGGIERRNGPFKEALQSWMQENNTTSWAPEGIHIIQRGINKRPSRAKGKFSPYEVFFGKKAAGEDTFEPPVNGPDKSMYEL